ncbi:helix-turn-helix transcriptional regulator [Aquimarina sp. TRL1]|uniref:helix-turn-helix domain-containing protein n=1 Tax=Aquimarina sp. (strain TRL1) TaxID=2736252 RepID=UPI00158F49B9|nr:AraC family transcriptional regulator [Aquimarina sp. TRL1]QKX06744.1 helix-turn-helix transcriptional regulator [Aquimarina sp. TRL1]
MKKSQVQVCPFCQSMHSALEDEVYCSKSNLNADIIKSNAFYYKSNKLFSGKHIGRLTVKMVFNGYQYLKLGKHDTMLTDRNYLIINPGQEWNSEIDSEKEVEGLTIAFHPTLCKQFIYASKTSTRALLDNPYNMAAESLTFFEHTYENDLFLRQLFLQFKKGILRQTNDALFFKELKFTLLEALFHKHLHTGLIHNRIPVKNSSLQKELFKRLGIAKDYILANIEKDLLLDDIGYTAALSSFHFLRLFKAVYKKTPHQFIMQERLKKACYLLKNSSKTIDEISIASGYKNHSAFSRNFKRHTGLTPLSFRLYGSSYSFQSSNQ